MMTSHDDQTQAGGGQEHIRRVDTNSRNDQKPRINRGNELVQQDIQPGRIVQLDLTIGSDNSQPSLFPYCICQSNCQRV